MNESVYQIIFDKISPFLPQDWSHMAFFAGYTKGSYTMKFYSKNVDGVYMDCYNIPGISRIDLIRLFMELDKILTPNRKEFGNDKEWTIMTLICDSEGHMTSAYDYNDHSEDMVSFEQKWQTENIK